MIYYISGQISGLPIETAEYNFKQAELYLKQKYGLEGNSFINPMELAKSLELEKVGNLHKFPSLEYEEFLAFSIGHLGFCDMVFFLQDWNKSHGAKIEHYLAEHLAIERGYLTELGKN